MNENVAAVARLHQRLAGTCVPRDDDRAATGLETVAERVRPRPVQNGNGRDAHVVVLVDRAPGRLGDGRAVGVPVGVARLQSEEAHVDVLPPRLLDVGDHCGRAGGAEDADGFGAVEHPG